MKTKSVYKIPYKVSGYYDHYFSHISYTTFESEESLLKAIQVIMKHTDFTKLETVYHFEDYDEDELAKVLNIEYEVTTVYLPYDIISKIYKETITEEFIDIKEIEKIAKIKKLKERSKSCTE